MSQLILNGKNIPYNQSEYLFKDDPLALKYYHKSKKNLKTGIIITSASFGVIIAGIVFIATDNHMGYCDTICFTNGDAIGFFAIGLGFPLLSSTGLLIHFKGRSQQKKAVDRYNLKQDQELSNKKEFNLKIGPTNHGIGFTLSF